MADTPEISREDSTLRRMDIPMTASEVQAWFVREVLPLEPLLTSFLQHNWRNNDEVSDIRQDVYERVCEAAYRQIPDNAKQFVFRTARNLLIDRVRRVNVVPIEAVADLDALDVAMDAPEPDRTAIARDELRRLQAALDRLPARAREAFVLGRIEGLSGQQIAERMGIAKNTVSIHLDKAIRLLVGIIYSEADARRKP
jgi:RNA polymerase sigma factor (sigma-70 family)